MSILVNVWTLKGLQENRMRVKRKEKYLNRCMTTQYKGQTKNNYIRRYINLIRKKVSSYFGHLQWMSLKSQMRSSGCMIFNFVQKERENERLLEEIVKKRSHGV